MTDAVMRRCLSCYAAFPTNATFEHAPVGLRMAFDPARGRLWLICGACARWTLVPFEARWEALEELERTCADRARLLKQGENVGLYRFGRVEVIRVGRTGLREEAWWRYGLGFLSRADRARGLVRRGRIIHTLWALALTGVPIWGFYNAKDALARARRSRFGDVAWKGYSVCPTCDGVQRRLLFSEMEGLVVEADGGVLHVRLACHRCGAAGTGGARRGTGAIGPGNAAVATREAGATGATGAEAGHRWRGVVAEHVLRRALAFHNFAGAGQPDVESAIGLVDHHGGPAPLIHDLARNRTPLGALTRPQYLAGEIALNASLEDALLGDEVADLEARWREEEELAAIIDGELGMP